MTELFTRADFLRVRAGYIRTLLAEGESFEEVCRTMAMDPMQVQLVAMSRTSSLPFGATLREAAAGTAEKHDDGVPDDRSRD